MPARFLLFDADYTLLDFPRDMDRAFCAMYASCFASQRPYADTLLACYNACNDRAWARFERGECTKHELYISRFVEFLSQTGLAGDPEHINDAYFRAMAQTGTPYPGAKELLDELAPAHELYMITNGNAVSQMPRLENAGLAGYFRRVFVSEEVGVGKPDKRYFDHVAAHIPGFEAEQAIVIGDSLSSDIQGAVNAGLRSIWFNPTGAWESPLPTTPAYTWRAETYGDILELLKYV